MFREKLNSLLLIHNRRSLKNMSDQKANKVLLIVVAVIAVVALVVSVAVNKPSKQLDRSTPEGAVQAYLAAVVAGDFEAAAKWLDTKGNCTVDDLDRAYYVSDVQINLKSSTESSNSAVVKIGVENSNGDPFGGTFTEDHTLRLVKSANGWLISGIPWPMYECGGVK